MTGVQSPLFDTSLHNSCMCVTHNNSCCLPGRSVTLTAAAKGRESLSAELTHTFLVCTGLEGWSAIQWWDQLVKPCGISALAPNASSSQLRASEVCSSDLQDRTTLIPGLPLATSLMGPSVMLHGSRPFVCVCHSQEWRKQRILVPSGKRTIFCGSAA